MLRPICTLAFAAAAAAQLTPAALSLGDPNDPGVVDADLVVFEVEVLAPDGVWLAGQAGPFQTWVYNMNAHWMARRDDQLPLQAATWSLPNLLGTNAWATGFFQAPQHLSPGHYLMAMADDVFEPGRDPSPVIPRATPSVFQDGAVSVTALGYAVDPTTNAVLQRPPFAGFTLQPCDLVGTFPYATLPGAPPVTIAWLAGAHAETCSGVQGSFGGPATGLYGSCSRWILENWSAATPAPLTLTLRLFRQDLLLGAGPVLPPAIAAVCGLELAYGPPSAVDVDLAAAMPGLFPNGGRLRIAPSVFLPMAPVNATNLDLVLPVPSTPALVGVHVVAQAAALDAAMQLNVTDLYGVRLR